MKKQIQKILMGVMLLVVGVIAYKHYQKKMMTQELNVLDESGNPSCVLVRLLAALPIAHDGTLKNIVQITQQRWLRAAGKELWDINDQYAGRQDELFRLIADLGCVHEIHPKHKQYTYALVLGASVKRFRNRLAYLVRQWEQGVRFEKLVFLGGKRPLDSNIESIDVLIHQQDPHLVYKKGWVFNGILPTDEAEMIRFVVDQSDIPLEMRQVPTIFIESPMKMMTDGSKKRPTTQDTLTDWLQTNPQQGSCLAISNQPFVGYQHAVLKTILPSYFAIETIGIGIDGDYHANISALLDTIARWLYQEQKYLESIK